MILNTLFITCGIAGFAWLGQSLRFVEMIVRYKVGFLAYIQLSFYLLPDLISGILPIGMALGATTTLRYMRVKHELRAMQSLGLGPWHICKPFLMASILGSCMTFVCGNFCTPYAFQKLHNNKQLLTNHPFPITIGTFQSVKGITLYVGDHSQNDLLHHIFIDAPPYTFIAQIGRLTYNHHKAGCYLNKGYRLERKPHGRLEQMYFDEIYYDLSDVYNQYQSGKRSKKPSEHMLSTLLWPNPGLSYRDTIRMQSEGHQRIMQPLLALADVWIVCRVSVAWQTILYLCCAHVLSLIGIPIILSHSWWLVFCVHIVVLCAICTGWIRLYRKDNAPPLHNTTSGEIQKAAALLS